MSNISSILRSLVEDAPTQSNGDSPTQEYSSAEDAEE